MQATSLYEALGGITAIPQWFVWRLTWDAEEGKFHKSPCAHPSIPFPMDSALPSNWVTFEEAQRRVAEWEQIDHAHRYAIGWRMTPGCGYWFLDMDKHVTDGVYSPLAQDWYSRLPGVFFELSSSGRGLHFIGRDWLMPHRCRSQPRSADCELYTQDRGIAFGLSGQAWGNADASGGQGIVSIAAETFPPAAHGEDGEFNGPRADWSGPVDDDELIALARKSVSVAARFGQRASFGQIFDGEASGFYGGASELDMALAQHLAFWTGCDGPRMERIMRRSKIVREKWDGHKTYLRELTIANACAMQTDVYKQRAAAVDVYAVPAVLPPLPVITPAVGAETVVAIEKALDLIGSAQSDIDIHNRIIPQIKQFAIPAAFMPKILKKLNAALKQFDADMPMAQLRGVVGAAEYNGGPREDDIVQATRPLWADNYVYLKQPDAFLERSSGAIYTGGSLHRALARLPEVPLKERGTGKMDVAELLTEHWDVMTAHDTFYHARFGETYTYDNKLWFNSYNPATVPMTALQYTGAANPGINSFISHIKRMCAERHDVFVTLINWIAHQVQRPGHKIRWAPIIVGFEGSGKTLIGKLLKATMGSPNVTIVESNDIGNKGGFTDWAQGRAVTLIEEIYLSGAQRYEVLNSVKAPISNDEVSINRKGKTGLTIPNGTNYIAFTNHHDAIPLNSDTDRRWFVIFTPFATIGALLASAGVANDKEYFDAMYDSIALHPGEWRKWLMEWKLPEDWPPMRPPHTDEKAAMAHSAKDEMEVEIASVLDSGGPGVTLNAFSSRMLGQLLMAKGVKTPSTNTLHYLYTRLGYISVRQIHWNGQSHRVWAKPGVSSEPDYLRNLLSSHTGHPEAPNIPNK